VTTTAKVKETHIKPAPLCIDLDGTLANTDTLVEGWLTALWNKPSNLLRLLPALLHGKAAFKKAIARESRLDVALLPYNVALLDYLKEQKKQGRVLVLVTAANEAIARAVANHLQLFDAVIASDDRHNLRGMAKAKALCERFGSAGFSYAGNDRADLPIWEVAHSAILVNASARVWKHAKQRVAIEQCFDNPHNSLAAFLRALRPYQWAKNSLVFVPIVTAAAFVDVIAWAHAALMFIAFCLTASGIYLINDIFDLSADRQHPRKRLRPFASGALPLGVGLISGPLFVASGVALALAVGTSFLLACYAAVSILYSMKLKELPLVDIFALSALYMVRLIAGGEATGYFVSLWLLAFSGFLFFSLAVIKRVAELQAGVRLGRAIMHRRGYGPNDLSILQMMGVGASFVSALVLALYVQDVGIARYKNPMVLWAIVPLLLLWQCRLWLATARGQMNDDPIVYAAKDWVSRSVAAAVMIVIVLAAVSGS
jgi:4-hydroxybenzoate polyprenyltransferase/phosphoserine phosphatase